MAARTRRTWNPRTVGFSTPNDVRDLQTKVQAYHEQLLIALTNLQQAGTPLPSSGPFTQAAWDAMTKREEAFLAVSVNELNPLAWVDASSAYNQGVALVTELDAWRDQLASLKAPGVPSAPMPIPSSQTSFFGDIGTGLLLVLGILALHEFGGRR
ncbi:MAG TPA: hypothetical protein DEP35_06000 [Deltaproteobacteria bacterium]|jgi:hypothetical protein|nr:hypothetical protein [Deltaproteobacteria bacterium]